MATVARRVGIAFGSFVIAWLAVTLVARWLFGYGNILVWVLAALVGTVVYLAILGEIGAWARTGDRHERDESTPCQM